MTYKFTSIASGALLSIGLCVWAAPSSATVYLPGTADSCPGCTFGDHQVTGDPKESVAGTGGTAGISNNGDALNANRTYIYDTGAATALGNGTTARGDSDFAMLIWDMGMGNAFDTMRLYTHQDHYGGGLISDPFIAQDVMEYSVWGSNDGDNFVLLSDVVGFDINGEAPGVPTYTFMGTEPSVVFRGGSDAFGNTNAYTRDYTFDDAYRYFGIKASSISLAYPLVGGGFGTDADPEIDAIAGNAGPIVDVPEPGALVLLAAGLLMLAAPGARGRR